MELLEQPSRTNEALKVPINSMSTFESDEHQTSRNNAGPSPKAAGLPAFDRLVAWHQVMNLAFVYELQRRHPEHAERPHDRSDDPKNCASPTDPTPGTRLRYAVRDEPCMTRLTTMAAMPASTALACGDDSMSMIGFDAGACS